MSITNALQKGVKLLTNADYRFLILANRGRYDAMPDEAYLRRKFRAAMGRELDLDHPRTFNEKLQWLKLYNRNPAYTRLVDKYLVREYIAEKLGEEYLIPLVGAWDDPEDIDFAALPEQFVLKCNHNSGLGMCICKDKSRLDWDKVKAGLRAGLAQDYYLTGREWPYKDVPRKILCEKFMVDGAGTGSLTDYKFFCFNGRVDCVMVCIERDTGSPKFYFFDEEWNLKKYNLRGKAAPADFTLPMPRQMPEMFRIAGELSQGLPFARVDLYSCNDQIYFGEITFFPDSGFDANILPEMDAYWGDCIQLP